MSDEKDLKEQFNILFEDLDGPEAGHGDPEDKKDVKDFFADVFEEEESDRPASRDDLSANEETRRKIYEMGREEDDKIHSFEEDKREENASLQSDLLRKESRRFWIFTAIILVLTVAAILFILYSRGILGGGGETESEKESTPVGSSSEENPSQTESEEPTDDSSEETEEETPSGETEEPSSVLSHYANLFIVNTPTLNVRSEANATSKKIATLDEFAGGEIIRNLGDWLEISSGGINGFVSAEYCVLGDDAKSLAVEHAKMLVKVTGAESVNVRTSASTDSDVIEVVSNGCVFEYLGEDGDFYRVRYGSLYEGYISKSFSDYGYYVNEAIRLDE